MPYQNGDCVLPKFRVLPAVKTAPRKYIHLRWKVRLRGLLSVSLRDDLKIIAKRYLKEPTQVGLSPTVISL